MTRLTSGMLEGIPADLVSYDAVLKRRTGLGLFGIACNAAGVPKVKARRALLSTVAAVVPVTAGAGVIPGFSEAVGGIIAHLGCRAFVTEKSDVGGLAEAVKNGADVVFMADDDLFAAFDLRRRRLADNVNATARGYVCALEALAGGLSGKAVLVIGAGRVGSACVRTLLERGAGPAVYDVVETKARALSSECGITFEPDLKRALSRYSLIIEASGAPGVIGEGDVGPDTAVAAPGVPLGVSPQAVPLLEDRLIHDPLQIGVSVMLVMAACGRGEGQNITERRT